MIKNYPELFYLKKLKKKGKLSSINKIEFLNNFVINQQNILTSPTKSHSRPLKYWPEIFKKYIKLSRVFYKISNWPESA